MTLQHHVYESIDAVDGADWDRVVAGSGGDAFMDRRFVSAVGAAMAPVSKLWHVLVYDSGGEPVACASLCVFSVDLEIVAGEGARRFVHAVRRLAEGSMRLRVFFCGLPISVGRKSLAVLPHADGPAVIRRLDTVVQELARREKARVITYKEFGEEHRALLGPLAGRGYREAHSLVMNHFNPRFADFDEYLAALRSHYRNDIKRSRRKFAAAELRIERSTDVDEIERLYTPELHQLYEAVVRNSAHKLELLPADFFVDLARRYDGRLSLTAIWDGDEIIAFNWGLDAGESYHYLFCGLDYERIRDGDAFFNLMYAEMDNGLRSDAVDIEVGQTADAFKSRLGCEQQPLYVYVRGVGPTWRAIIRSGFKLLFPMREPTPGLAIYRKGPTTG